MPITIKTANMKYKNSEGEYVGVNAISDNTTAEQLARIEDKGDEVIASIPSDYTALETQVNNIEGMIASEFSTSTAYAIGDLVIYNDHYYRFKTAHPAGAWNASHVDQTTVSGEIISNVTDLKNSLNNDMKYKFPNDLMVSESWEQGSWSYIDTNPTRNNINNRIRTVVEFKATNHLEIQRNIDGYDYIYSIWDSNGTKISGNASWVSIPLVFTLTNDTYTLYLSIRKTDNSPITPEEMYKTGIGAIVDKSLLGFPVGSFDNFATVSDVNLNTSFIGYGFQNNLVLQNPKWVVGSWSYLDTNPIENNNVKNRIRNKFIITKNNILEIRPTKKEYEYVFGIYKNGTYFASSSAFLNISKKFWLPTGNYEFYIAIRKIDNSNIHPDELADSGIEIILNNSCLNIDNVNVSSRNSKAITNTLALMKTLGEQNNFLNNKICLFHISDTHSYNRSWSNLISIADKIQPDFILHTGDIARYTGLDDTDYIYNHLSDITTLVALGNHDVGNGANIGAGGLTNTDAFTRFINPLVTKYNITTQENYYYYDCKGVRFIILNVYDFDRNNGTVFDSRTMVYSQDQIDWLIETLDDAIDNSLPVVLCAHECDKILANNGGTGKFNQSSPETYLTNKLWTGSPVCDIIEAFINGTTINQTYNQSAASEYAPTLTVNKTFASQGEFICWLVGHRHSDVFGKLPGYNQLAITITCGTPSVDNFKSTNLTQDLARMDGTATEDAFNAVIIDKTNKKISLVRFGADKTALMEDRDWMTTDYIQNS